ncbi:carboxylesterase family protein [Maribacter sp. CXY002]|uniref:carboxylesterase family protein n=1 Tax=Maribacter luteocoastalis TaxID=3407671 RepID=UPI003B66E146
MIGSNSAEIGGGMVNSISSKEELFSLFGNLNNETRKAYDPNGTKVFDEVNSNFNTDWVWAEPARFVARSFVAVGQPAFVYQFGFVPDPLKERMPYGAGHGSEVSFVFNNLHARWGNPETTPEDKKVAEMMNAYWVNFAKTGNPNGEGLPEWPVFTAEENEILDIERDGSTIGKPDPRKGRLDVIEKSLNSRHKIQARGI